MMTQRVTRSSPLVALLVAFAATACGPSLSGAKNDFKSGRAADAKTTLVALEPDSASWTGTRRADYVLYRGLVHHSLGDREEAAHWLQQAKRIDRAEPKAYSPDDRTRLDLALQSLGL